MHTGRGFQRIVSKTHQILRISSIVRDCVSAGYPALLVGETGTGKRLISVIVHEELQINGPYTSISARDLVMDEICAMPSDGTVYVGDVTELPGETQRALLERLDGSVPEVSARTTAAAGTAGDNTLPALVFGCGPELAHKVCTGAFLPELYFALSRGECHIPPLRERPGDIPLLIKAFAEGAARELRRPTPRIDVAFIDRFTEYSFPGNVAELKMLVYKAVYRTEAERLSVDVARETMNNHSVEPVAKRLLKHDLQMQSRILFPSRLPSIHEAKKQLIMEALRRSGGNQSAAARTLGLTAPAISKFLSQTD